MASLKWTKDALSDLATIDFVIAQRIAAKARWLEENFSNVVPEALHQSLKGLFKLRIGDYRLIYMVHKDVIIVQAVGHRRDIYK